METWETRIVFLLFSRASSSQVPGDVWCWCHWAPR